MAILNIVTIPNPILNHKAREVKDFNNQLHKFINDMVETMRAAPGVGLAAPQVDEPLRVIVVEFGDEEDETSPVKLYTVINPKITRFSNDTEVGAEGCLSIPGFMGDVERPNRVTVKGYNRHGQPFSIKAKGWLARIFQHEVDHLNGILFIDKSERIWKIEEEPSQVMPAPEVHKDGV